MKEADKRSPGAGTLVELFIIERNTGTHTFIIKTEVIKYYKPQGLLVRVQEGESSIREILLGELASQLALACQFTLADEIFYIGARLRSVAIEDGSGPNLRAELEFLGPDDLFKQRLDQALGRSDGR